MSRNKQSRKYLIGRSYKNDEFDWRFDLVIVRITDKMATACLVICIYDSYAMAFDFYQEIHRTPQTLFRLRHSLPTSRSIKQSFLNILLVYLSRSVVSTGREMKIRRSMLCPWLASINNNINFKTTTFSCTYFGSDVFAIEVKDPKLYCSKYSLSYP